MVRIIETESSRFEREWLEKNHRVASEPLKCGTCSLSLDYCRCDVEIDLCESSDGEVFTLSSPDLKLKIEYVAGDRSREIALFVLKEKVKRRLAHGID